MSKIPISSDYISCFVIEVNQYPRDARYLLLQRSNHDTLPGTWQMITGGVEKNEPAWQAALREILEETSIRPDELYNTNIIENFYHARTNTICLCPTFVALIFSKKEVRLSRDHQNFAWLSMMDAREKLAFRQHKDNIKKIQREFVDEKPNALLKLWPARPIEF